MNSSGIKRGLATTAVSALAIAGIPFIASSANAAVGDEIVVAYTGTARNGAGAGAVLVLETKGITQAEAANLMVSNTTLNGSANNGTQTVGAVNVIAFNDDVANATDAEQEFGDNDGYDEIIVQIPVTTTTVGDSANFAIYLNDDPAAGVQASEPRAQASVRTAGNPTAVEIAPNSQVAAQGQLSGNYTVTIKDAAGRTTQLVGGEVVNLTATGGTNIVETGTTTNNTTPVTDDDSITAGESARGTATFKASNGNTGGYTITATGAGGVPATATTQATLNVVTAANIAAAEVDVVSGADNWPTDPAQRNYANPVRVRVDQGGITLSFASVDGPDADSTPDDANATVSFTVTSAGGDGVTFDGKTSKTYSVILDSQGKGSVAITPDAGTIQTSQANPDGFTVVGSGLNLDVDFVAAGAAAPDVQAANGQTATYISRIGGSVDVVVKVVDEFGAPVTSGFVDVRRSGGVNNETNFSTRKAVGADGTVTFTLTDTKATASSTAEDTILARYFASEFAQTPADGPESVGTIRYTADGTGNPISFTVDNVSVDGTGYNASKVTLNPLTLDGNATNNTVGANQNNDEFVNIGIVGGTSGVPVTVSADNGGLIIRVAGGGALPADRDEVADGAASVTGAAGDSYYLIATKTGPINVTVASAGKSKTAAVTSVPVPLAVGGASTARNVTVEGPTEAIGGDLVEFTATVTDGYGNPVSGVTGQVNVRVTGPARLQDTDATTDSNGQIGISVRIDDDADAPVTVSVEGISAFAQFGDPVNTIVNAGLGANNAPGIPASDNTDSATIDAPVNLEELEAAVEEAEANLAEAEANLAEAQADLDVAQTQLAIAQSEVDRLRERKAELRQKLNKAKDQGNRQKAKTTRKKLRKAKSDLRDAKEARTVAQADVDGLQEVADLREQAVTEAEEALAEAQANLDEAQN